MLGVSATEYLLQYNISTIPIFIFLEIRKIPISN